MKVENRFKPTPPIRLSVNQAAAELRVTHSKVLKSLRAHNINPGPDERYSFREMFIALNSDPLKAKSEEMRYQAIIAEAELKQLRVAEAKGELIPAEQVRKLVLDRFVEFAQRVKHLTGLTKAEKEDLINAFNPDRKDIQRSLPSSHNGT
jgi:hypothetical protein